MSGKGAQMGEGLKTMAHCGDVVWLGAEWQGQAGFIHTVRLFFFGYILLVRAIASTVIRCV